MAASKKSRIRRPSASPLPKGGAPDNQDKPFAKGTRDEARKIAKGYTISVRELEGHGYVGCSIELPTIEGYGDTPQLCYESTRDAGEFTVATMLERGEVPPLPAAAEQRTAQVNVKLTPLERDMFSALAQRLGYKGLSDFIRSTVLRVFSSP
jgi:predicted RNase H-like HicB family nuclease